MINTGIQYLDKITGGYRLGDNIVWQISDGIPIDDFIKTFFRKRNNFNQNVIYISFNYSPQTICKKYSEIFENQKVILVDAFTKGKGTGDYVFLEFYSKEKPFSDSDFILLENPRDRKEFTNALIKIEEENRDGSFYIFDSLTGMSELWKDEGHVLDFFTYSCPKLYDLNTLAYWIYEKDAHSKEFIAGVSHTTQIIFSLQNTAGEFFDFSIQKLEGRSSLHKKSPHQFKISNQVIQFQEKKEDIFKIGEKVKNLRKKNNKTQAELASLLGLTAGAVSQIENSIISPSLNTLLQISSIFGKSPEYFIDSSTIAKKNKSWLINKKKLRNEYPRNKIEVYEILDNEEISLKLFSVKIKGKQTIEGPLFLHKGQEIIYINEGSLILSIEEDEFELKTNESLLVGSSFIQKIQNNNSLTCEVIYILF